MRNILFALVFVGLGLLYGCGGDGGFLGIGGDDCEQAEYASDTFLDLTFFDKNSRKPLLGVLGSYPRGQVYIYDKDGNTIAEPDNGDGRMVIRPIAVSETVIGKTYRNQFYIYFSNTDIDTIETTHRIESYNADCKNNLIDFIEVRYQDSLYYKGASSPSIDFFKK
jgi:hypothetical protein